MRSTGFLTNLEILILHSFGCERSGSRIQIGPADKACRITRSRWEEGIEPRSWKWLDNYTPFTCVLVILHESKTNKKTVSQNSGRGIILIMLWWDIVLLLNQRYLRSSFLRHLISYLNHFKYVPDKASHGKYIHSAMCLNFSLFSFLMSCYI